MTPTDNRHAYHRWDLFGCALSGHETYRPTGGKQADDLAGRLRADTPQGEAWLCLRCGLFVAGRPRFSGPLDQAPVVMRGKMLRQAVILRALAIERLLRGLVLALLAYGILRFKSSQGSLTRVLEQSLPGLHSVANVVGYNLDNSRTLHLVREALNLGQHTLTLLALGIFAYAAIELIEAVGLWLMKRWGEYFAVIATSIFIPLEIYELLERFTIFKLGAFVINVAAVAYLLYSKRLFGLRGGAKAYENELQGENLLQLVKAGH